MASFPGSAVSFVQLANGTVTDASQMNVAYNEIEAIQNVLLGNTESNIRLGALTGTNSVLTVAGYSDNGVLTIKGYSTQTGATFTIVDTNSDKVLAVTNSPAAGDTKLILYSTVASKGAFVEFYQENTNVWQLGKNNNNDFVLYDVVGSANAVVITTKGNILFNSATDLGKELLSLQQDDADKAFIDFDGTSSGDAANNISTLTGGNTIQGFVKVEIEGVERWMPYYDAPTE